MGLKGTFKDFSVSDIIQLIHYQKKSGRLTARKGDSVWVLGFEKGKLVHASTDERGMPRLGEILLRQGYIDRESLAGALREQDEKGLPLGQMLVKMGKIQEEDIGHALSFQLQETALNLFFHQDSEYMFERLPVKYDPSLITPINTEFILMEGSRRLDEWPAIADRINGADAVFEHNPEEKPRRNSSTDSHNRIFELVDGTRTVEGLVRNSGMGVFETARLLGDLVMDRAVVLAVEGSASLRDPVTGNMLDPRPHNPQPVASGAGGGGGDDPGGLPW
ncbi:MAG: DUF4388 domain-containing protein [Nitrospirota bacterium]|nr:DUF4388 domain-containing protein [Nitrospirota bacterium]